ncbi:hypothetical protein ACFV1L_22010 [Kitasatospora sp. NPDC059646]|uniref:hypothetical protein n=1 Tax=Kitasatospora sp. NPDC059646 TaxID=3346893 RepID=UPI00367C3050
MPAQTYTVPGDPRAAADQAAEAARNANDRLGRTAAAALAAAVRDILTMRDDTRPFDAAHIELVESEFASLTPTGRYWTADGTAQTFADTEGVTDPDAVMWELREESAYLEEATRDGWSPVVTELPSTAEQRTYRLDLAAAAALPLD